MIEILSVLGSGIIGNILGSYGAVCTITSKKDLKNMQNELQQNISQLSERIELLNQQLVYDTKPKDQQLVQDINPLIPEIDSFANDVDHLVTSKPIYSPNSLKDIFNNQDISLYFEDIRIINPGEKAVDYNSDPTYSTIIFSRDSQVYLAKVKKGFVPKLLDCKITPFETFLNSYQNACMPDLSTSNAQKGFNSRILSPFERAKDIVIKGVQILNKREDISAKKVNHQKKQIVRKSLKLNSNSLHPSSSKESGMPPTLKKNIKTKLELDKDAQIFYKKGYDLFFENQFLSAVDSFNKAIELEPDYAIAFSYRGQSYETLSIYDKALRDYTKAIELNPDQKYFYLMRAELYNNLSKFQKAIDDINIAIHLDNSNSVFYNFRGWMRYKLSQYELSIKDYSQSIHLNPLEKELVFLRRGEAYLKLELYEQAVKDFSSSIEAWPNAPEVYIKRAKVYEKLKKYKLSRKDFLTAKKIQEFSNSQY